jgi:general secretion pathway protein F
MRSAIASAADQVREGVNLARALEDTGLFPPVTLQLLASGETSGNVGAMLDRAAAEQERELESLTSGFLAILEPMLILVMGGVVLLIVLAILMPVFEMNQLIR